MSAPSMAAACSSGAISAWARSVQWDPSPWAGPPPVGTDPTSTSDRAMVRARKPFGARLEWRPPQWAEPRLIGATDPVGIEQEALAELGPGVDGGVEDVRFGGRGDDRTVAHHHVGNDQRRCLPRPRWTEDHHRLLGSNEAPTALAVPQIRSVPGVGGRVQYGRESAKKRRCGGVDGKKSFVMPERLAICSFVVYRGKADDRFRDCSDSVTVSNNPCKQTVFCPCASPMGTRRIAQNDGHRLPTVSGTRSGRCSGVRSRRWCLTWR